ncbi:MAG TPA: hypothetical protein VIH90_04380 [Candidatus Saccharimonadales bacterium]
MSVDTATESQPSSPERLIHTGDIDTVLDGLIETPIGVGLFTEEDADKLQSALEQRGFTHRDIYSSSNVSAGSRESVGELHRHGVGQLIVHRTVSGEGLAHFYWPDQDVMDFPYEEDLTGKMIEVECAPGTVIVFPSQSWHQFDTRAEQHRVAKFMHYSPPETADK